MARLIQAVVAASLDSCSRWHCQCFALYACNLFQHKGVRRQLSWGGPTQICFHIDCKGYWLHAYTTLSQQLLPITSLSQHIATVYQPKGRGLHAQQLSDEHLITTEIIAQYLKAQLPISMSHS